MPFCSGNTETIVLAPTSDPNYYYANFTASCLPNSGSGWSSTPTTAAVSTHVSSLQDAAAPLPADLKSNSMAPADVFQVKSESLRTAIQKEYCFYYVRYSYALTQLLTSAATGTPPQGETYANLKTNVTRINAKLNQILLILQALIRSRAASLTSYGSDADLSNIESSISSSRSKLNEHANILKNTYMEKDIQTAMIDYTLEKNSSSRNLLAVYGFMNIVALGMLFYLYNAAKA